MFSRSGNPLLIFLQSYHVSYQQVDRLIDILQRKPNDKFEPFLDSLRDENSDLYDSLTGGSGETVAKNHNTGYAIMHACLLCI